MTETQEAPLSQEPTEKVEEEPTPEVVEKVEEPTPEVIERVVLKAEEYEIPNDLPVEELGKFANKNDFTQDQLTSTISLFQKTVQDINLKESTARQQAGEKFVKDWGEESKTKLALANRALKMYDPDGKLAAFLSDPKHKYGSDPSIIGYLYAVGKDLEEGGFLTNETNAVKPKTAAEIMYPNHSKEE